MGVGMGLWDKCRDQCMGWVSVMGIGIGVGISVGIAVWAGCRDWCMGWV